MKIDRRTILGSVLAGFVPTAAEAFPGSAKVFDANSDLIGQISDWLCDCQMDAGREPGIINLTRRAYYQLARDNCVDNMPDDSNDNIVPMTFGQQIVVSDTKLSRPLRWPLPKCSPICVDAAPAGTPIFGAHDGLAEHIVDSLSETQELDGDGVIYFSPNGYKCARRHNLIDYIPGENGRTDIAVFLGHPIRVVRRQRAAA